MAQNTNITCPTGAWTLLTNSNVTALRAMNIGSSGVWLQATVGATPPSNTIGAIQLLENEILAADLTIAQLWPGVAGANRVYAMAPDGSELSVSHA
jgi:hypothetical protein